MNSPAPNWLKGRAVRWSRPEGGGPEYWIVADEPGADHLIRSERAAGRELPRGRIWTWAEVREINRLEVEDAREAGDWKSRMNAVVAEARSLR